ncbi:MAG: chorismate-binding protein [Desulfobacterales bacterium]|nr:chorismate-binding protein [Desulfobacterales bacterium]
MPALSLRGLTPLEGVPPPASARPAVLARRRLRGRRARPLLLPGVRPGRDARARRGRWAPGDASRPSRRPRPGRRTIPAAGPCPVWVGALRLRPPPVVRAPARPRARRPRRPRPLLRPLPRGAALRPRDRRRAGARCRRRRGGCPRGPARRARAGRATAAPRGRAQPDQTPAAYTTAVSRILEHVRAGDVYEVCYTLRCRAPLEGHPAGLYLVLRDLAPAPLGAFLPCGAAVLLSNSPELFLSYDPATRRVESRPIKGTRPRGRDADDDARLRRDLHADAKEIAEHVMIVDLVRNDLGRVATVGSVVVEGYGRNVALPTVHHRVSTVRATLRAGVGLAELLRATFPGGSVTGAPKVRAMEIIDELEPCRREVLLRRLRLRGRARRADAGDGHPHRSLRARRRRPAAPGRRGRRHGHAPPPRGGRHRGRLRPGPRAAGDPRQGHSLHPRHRRPATGRGRRAPRPSRRRCGQDPGSRPTSACARPGPAPAAGRARRARLRRALCALAEGRRGRRRRGEHRSPRPGPGPRPRALAEGQLHAHSNYSGDSHTLPPTWRAGTRSTATASWCSPITTASRRCPTARSW